MPETCAAGGVACNINFTKGINLDNSGTLNSISQTINIPADGNYFLHIDWIPPFTKGNGKKWKINVNSTTVFYEKAIDSIPDTHVTETVIAATAGQMVL